MLWENDHRALSNAETAARTDEMNRLFAEVAPFLYPHPSGTTQGVAQQEKEEIFRKFKRAVWLANHLLVDGDEAERLNPKTPMPQKGTMRPCRMCHGKAEMHGSVCKLCNGSGEMLE